MRISELAATTGSNVSTIKYYLREGLMPPGVSRGATQADYGPAHVHRIRVVKALAEVAGLPLHRVREVLRLIDEPGEDTFSTLGRAVAALPPYLHDAGAQESESGTDYPLARAAMESLGQVFDPGYAAVAQLERALQAVAAAGIPLGDEQLAVYGRSLMEMAEYDIAGIPGEPAATVEHAVLGTALYEPVILALRRLAHQDAAARRLGDPPRP
ncbi:MerR family transcriptional regulator [Arthrobacter sp.]|uniref:MerR family transcriptional regulator n=1 Tax=Arthrobacter sp. TaxID=1667 RepID=UPI003A906632